jgi:ABC-2 type transport system permease protein
MKSYLATIKGSLISMIIYRLNFFFMLMGNLLYMTIVYFLWKSIYRGSETIHGMTFNQAFVYLALAGSIYSLLFSGADWQISHKIINGGISIDLLKPLDFQFLMLARTSGYSIFNLIVVAIPSVLVIFLVFRADLSLGIGWLFFPLGILMAFLINFAIDFAVGLTAFYTESLWGISITKGVIISLLSGALVPLQFFPATVQHILRFLPFQAIYNIPLIMVTSPNFNLAYYVQILAIQAFWVILLFAICRRFYTRALTILSISGG